MRFYPSWCTNLNKTDRATQKWQLDYLQKIELEEYFLGKTRQSLVSQFCLVFIICLKLKVYVQLTKLE